MHKKIEKCSIEELSEWCEKRYCKNCIFLRREDNFCPVNAFNNFIAARGLENMEIDITEHS